jgi:tetratricopeptide (TPR) repeat protein
VQGTGLYVRSPAFVKRAMLSYDSLAADVYWIRAVQHYGRTKLAPGGPKRYELLYPLLDLTTSLDPNFSIAYRFGAIFLAEPPPGGAGRPDQAIALLEKGLEAQPLRWEYAQDIGFVYYWWGHDYQQAAAWFTRASGIEGAPDWMKGLAAVTAAKHGDRATSRSLWSAILTSANEDWLHAQAQFRLRQLAAMDQIDALESAARRYREQTGAWPRTWASLGIVQGSPADPDGFPYQLNADTGAVTLDPVSTVNPLPLDERTARR